MKMGKRNRLQERSAASYERSKEHVETRSGTRGPHITLSLKDYDSNQGESFEHWEQDQLLALAVSKLRFVCSLTKQEATQQQIIKEYPPRGSFPPSSDFYHPKHIDPNVLWCAMRIQGKERIIGYFEDHVFYIVFLDKDHRFWITEKKHT